MVANAVVAGQASAQVFHLFMRIPARKRIIAEHQACGARRFGAVRLSQFHRKKRASRQSPELRGVPRPRAARMIVRE